MTSLLAKEILQKEEMLLKETKVKLLEQLNRLKVEEVALQKYLLDITENQPEENNAEGIEKNRYQPTLSHNEDPVYEDDVNTLNQMPLENLKLSDTKQMNQDTEEEEEEEEEEEDDDQQT